MVLYHRVLTDPKDVETFYSGKAEHSKTARGTTGSLFGRTLSDAVGLINGDAWKDLRKSLDRFFSFQSYTKITPFICRSAEEYAKSFPERRLSPESTDNFEKSYEGRIVINVVQAVQPYAFFVSAEIFYGALNTMQRDELWQSAQDFLKVAGFVVSEGMNRTRYTKWLYSLAGWRALWKFEQGWQAFNRKIAKQKENEVDLPIVQLYEDIRDGKVAEQTVNCQTRISLDETILLMM